jgi:spore germination protein PF
MPALVGPIQIVSVGGGVVQFGDAAWLSPKTSSKTYAGSGGFNTGNFIVANNVVSGTNVLDANLIDQPTIGNN